MHIIIKANDKAVATLSLVDMDGELEWFYQDSATGGWVVNDYGVASMMREIMRRMEDEYKGGKGRGRARLQEQE